MTRHQFPSSRSLALRCSVGLVFSFVLAATAQAGNTFSVTNLVTSSQSANIAPVTDPNLINPWGVSFTPTSPLWVSDNGTGVSTLYSITNSDQVSIVTSPDFPVVIPGGTPTGQIANTNSAAFGGDAFVFVSQSGAVTGWQPSFGNTAQVIVAANAANSYDGAAQVTVNGDTYLLAANNKTGNIDVIAGTPNAPNLSGTFKDPNLPAGSMPYNVQTLNGVVYVLYFPQFSAMVSVLFELAACGYGLASLREGESRGSAGGCCCDSPGDPTFRLAICTDTPPDCRL
jgi:uncharacterized protein (TIGR03118 family)